MLGIIEAWQSHRSANTDDDVLVVTTDVDDAQLGWDIRAHAVGRTTKTVDRVEIVKQRFGVVDIDPRIRRESWLADALLDAEPPSGWQRPGPVLTRDAAVRALIGARLGGTALAEGGLDAGALLSWSQSPAGSSFTALPETERSGLTAWLVESIGDSAAVLMSLAAAGRAEDAMALGVLGSVVSSPGTSTEAALAFGGLLGAVRPRGNELPAFVEAVEGTLERWTTEAESGGTRARLPGIDCLMWWVALTISGPLLISPKPWLPIVFCRAASVSAFVSWRQRWLLGVGRRRLPLRKRRFATLRSTHLHGCSRSGHWPRRWPYGWCDG